VFDDRSPLIHYSTIRPLVLALVAIPIVVWRAFIADASAPSSDIKLNVVCVYATGHPSYVDSSPHKRRRMVVLGDHMCS
jgi:hypothetical protein